MMKPPPADSAHAGAHVIAPLKSSRHAGFTLIELIIAMTIFGILAAIAVPSFTSLIANHRASVAASDLYFSLALARSEATKRNARVTLAPTTAGASGWNDGWQIQAPDPSGAATPLTLENHAAVKGATISGPTTIVYLSSGRIMGTAAPTGFSISVPSGSSSVQRCVSTDLGGRPLITAVAC